MATFGYSTTPTYGYIEAAPTGAQAAGAATMPSPGGIVTSVSCYCGVFSGQAAASGYLCMWSSSGSLLASGAATIPASPAWVTATLSTATYVASGVSVFLGWQTPGISGYYAEFNSVSGATMDLGSNSTIPGALANITQHTNDQLGAYATYTPGGAQVWNGTAWQSVATYVWNGTQWVSVVPQVWNGTTWVSVT